MLLNSQWFLLPTFNVFHTSGGVAVSVSWQGPYTLPDDVHLIAFDEVVVATKATSQFYPS